MLPPGLDVIDLSDHDSQAWRTTVRRSVGRAAWRPRLTDQSGSSDSGCARRLVLTKFAMYVAAPKGAVATATARRARERAE